MKINEFRDYLLTQRIVPETNIPFYQRWVSSFFTFTGSNGDKEISTDDIKRFERHLSKTYQEWQVKQAREAVRIYGYFIRKKQRQSQNVTAQPEAWKKTVDEMRKILRLKHRAYSTEQACLGWMKSRGQASQVRRDGSRAF